MFAKKSFFVFLAVVFVGVLLYGCTSSTPMQEEGRGDRNRSFGNMTQEQRQAFAGQRIQQSISACEGKSENVGCFIESPMGIRNGTCRLLNGTLACAMEFNGRGNSRRGFGPRNQS